MSSIPKKKGKKTEHIQMEQEESSEESPEEGSNSESSDSEESVYSGLDDEAETSSDEEEQGSDEEEEDSDGEESDDEDSDEEEEELDNSQLKKAQDEISARIKNSNGAPQTTTTMEDNDNAPKKASSTQSDKSSSKGNAPPPVNVNVQDEYEFDSSDEEDLRNTVGNVPMEWYKEFEHIGYDLLGEKIIKPRKGDQLDEFLNKMDNPDYWRSVEDKSTGQKVVLSDKDAEMVQRYRKGKYIDPTFDPYQPWLDFFTNETMIHPVKNTPAHKRSFIPSLWEKKKVSQYVHAMKMGWMKPPKTPTEKAEGEEEDEEERPAFYELWATDKQEEPSKRSIRQHIPAPKLTLPGHAESYNPPPEYLLTEEEEIAWKDRDPEERRVNFLPHKYPSLRQVPAYSRFANERFERCLDLYLCPRQRKMRMNVDPEDLIPKLPKPQELQPFPTTQALVYRGHTGLVRCISVSPSGQWLASGSDDGTLRLWEVATARCMKTLQLGQDTVVRGLAWNPSQGLCLLAVACGKDVVIVNPGLGDKLVISNTDNLLATSLKQEQPITGKKAPVEWEEYSMPQQTEGFRIRVTHTKDVVSVSWHSRGDYFVSVAPDAGSNAVIIHQLSKGRSQLPFTKAKGLVQRVVFHPTRPFLFVATQRYVRVYNLLKQELSKKLLTNCKWVSSLAVHPGGDNLIIGSYDCRLSWFDLDLSNKPYQTLKHQKKAIRAVCYHKTYPLFASCSDDGTVVVCHGRVYNDLLQNPLIVPVKILRGHEVRQDLGVLDCQFHPTQPWIFSAGADHTIRLYS